MSTPYVGFATREAAQQLKAQQARIDAAREALAKANADYAEENAARLARQKSRLDEGTTMYDPAKVDAYFASSGTIAGQPYVTTSNSGFGGSKSMRRNRRLKRARKTRRGRSCSHKRACRCCRCRNSRK
jgi:multidrug efflux pump subunit AcrA (membrane-fusion protein)